MKKFSELNDLSLEELKKLLKELRLYNSVVKQL
jgi:ribosomal protein L29